MKVNDLPAAQAIVTALVKLKREESALDAGVASAGIRCRDNGSTWINFPVPMHDQLVARMREGIAAERARLHRHAAQIGLAV